MYRSVITVAVLFSACLVAESISQDWPPPEHLAGFWPLTGKASIGNVVTGESMTEIGAPKIWTSIPGPFGKPATSFGVYRDAAMIGYRRYIALTSSFTVSFYYLSHMNTTTGGILHFFDGQQQHPLFVVNSRHPNLLELWSGPAWGTFVGQYPILEPHQWNFITITYSAATSNLVVYSQPAGKKLVKVASAETFVPAFSRSTMYFGYSNWGTSALSKAYMSQTDALACVMYYTTVLTQEQVQKLPGICEKMGNYIVDDSSSSTRNPHHTWSSDSSYFDEQTEAYNTVRPGSFGTHKFDNYGSTPEELKSEEPFSRISPRGRPKITHPPKTVFAYKKRRS